MAHDGDPLKLRELIRELRDAEEFGLRDDPPKYRLRIFKNLLVEWIYNARETEDWDEGHCLKLGKNICELLRDMHYQRELKVDVESIRSKMEAEERTGDRFAQLAEDERAKQKKIKAKTGPGSFGRKKRVCFICHQIGHLQKDCRSAKTGDFEKRVDGSAIQGSKRSY